MSFFDPNTKKGSSSVELNQKKNDTKPVEKPKSVAQAAPKPVAKEAPKATNQTKAAVKVAPKIIAKKPDPKIARQITA